MPRPRCPLDNGAEVFDGKRSWLVIRPPPKMEIFFRGEPAARPYSGTSMVTSMNHQGLTPEDEKSPLPPFSKRGVLSRKPDAPAPG